MMMSKLRRFLPYVVLVVKHPSIAPAPTDHRGRIQWGIVVCDREYNLLFASWLKRKLTTQQVSAFALDLHAWDDKDGGHVWLYDDSSVPDTSDVAWHAYADRLQALARVTVLYAPNWGSETPADYTTALARWKTDRGHRIRR